MASYAVNTAQLRGCAEKISGIQRELDSVALRLAGFQLGTTLQMRGTAALMVRIGDCKWAAVCQSDDMGRMSTGLLETVGLFENCEKNLAEPKTQARAEPAGVAGIAAEEDDWDFWEDFWDEYPILDLLGTTCEVLGDVVKKLGDVFSNWASGIINVIGSGIDNVREFMGDLGNPQFWFEFIGEAAVDIGVNVGVGAGVTAVVGLIIGGPVSVLGAVGITLISSGICGGIDAFCEWAFDGRDLSEAVVDGLWWLGEKAEEGVNFVVDAAGDFVDAAADFVSDTVDAIQEGAEAAWNAAGEFFNTLLPW